MDIVTLTKDLFKTKNLQRWVNHRYRHSWKFIIDSKQFPYVLSPDKIIFSNSENLLFVIQATKEYNYCNLLPEDIVIDIGANVGGFSLKSALISKNIYAVEPLYYDELIKNIQINNNNNNITVIQSGLGNGQSTPLIWQNKCGICPTLSFKDILNITNGCNFLKIDCEGYEWFINPLDLENTRRIEIECHPQNPSNYSQLALLSYLYKNYNLLSDPLNKTFPSNAYNAFNLLKQNHHFILHLKRKSSA